MKKPELYQKADPYIGAYYFQDDIRLLEVVTGETQLRHDEQAHMHNEIEMLLITEGEGILTVNGVDMPVTAGSFAWLLPFHVHALRSLGRSKLAFHFCRYSLSMLVYLKINRKSTEASMSILEYIPPCIQLKEEDALQALDCFRGLERENEARELDYELLLYAAVLRLIALFERRAAPLVEGAMEAARPLGWNALQYLQAHFNRRIDAATVAALFQVSVSQLNGALRLLTGRNFQQNLGDVRVRNACAMMQFEELTIPYISEMAGFATVPSFYRQFKERKGVTPDAYRRGKNGNEGQKTWTDKTYAILHYATENYREPITAETAADALYISKGTVNSELGKNLGCTFTELLHSVRAWVSAGLLLGTEMPVCDIAMATGFNSVRSFGRCFQQEFGTSPTAFRRSGAQEGRVSG